VGLPYLLEVFGVEELVGVAPDELLGVVAEQGAARRRGIGVDALRRVFRDHVRRVLGQEPVELVALAQLPFKPRLGLGQPRLFGKAHLRDLRDPSSRTILAHPPTPQVRGEDRGPPPGRLG
jgi:hypothetical protein